MTFIRATLALCVAAAAAGCVNTRGLLLEQELAVLKNQVEQTNRELADFAQVPDPERISQFSALIPASLLNDILGKFDDTVIDPPDPALKDIRVVVRSVRTEFDAALPYVHMEVSACKRPPQGSTAICSDPTATLKATTYLAFTVSSPGSNTLSAALKVHLTDVVPSVRVRWWQLRLSGFVRDLIKAQLAQAIASQLPTVELPLQMRIPINFPQGIYAVGIPGPRAGSRLDARVTTPGYADTVQLTVFRVVFLQDGVHLFFRVS